MILGHSERPPLAFSMEGREIIGDALDKLRFHAHAAPLTWLVLNGRFWVHESVCRALAEHGERTSNAGVLRVVGR